MELTFLVLAGIAGVSLLLLRLKRRKTGLTHVKR
jgi:hypothetical protein